MQGRYDDNKLISFLSQQYAQKKGGHGCQVDKEH